MKNFILASLCLAMVSLFSNAKEIVLQSKYVSLSINQKGYVTSIKSLENGKEYAIDGKPSALLALYEGNEKAIYPVSATQKGRTITLSYPNGSTAVVAAQENNEYINFKLLSLDHREQIDNVVWGPYHTSVRKYIGDVIGVVSDNTYSIGLFATDDNTITGLPSDGDLYQMFYYVHSVDPVKYPIPDSLSEGQKFTIGGDGWSDVAFYSKPEEYFHLNSGCGAIYDPTYGSSVVMHARDRRKPQTIFFTLLPGFKNINVPKHHDVETIDVDFIGSSIAFYGCPKEKTIQVLEKIVKGEGLPYVTREGKWIRNPESFRADVAWWGRHDSLISYCNQLGVKAVQDEGLGEYYANPADRWAGKTINYGGKQIPIAEFTKLTNENGIAYGIHTLCEFLQPHCSDVSPVPNDSLCLVLRTKIVTNVSASDTAICVADTSWLNEHGTWHCNKLNVLKLGKELLTYEGVTTTKPYTLTGVKRGAYKTVAQSHKAGTQLGKLQMNCYNGFVPDMNLQDDYANYYAKLLIDGGMNYVDFDGQESYMYQGHGTYSFKRFYRELFTKFKEYGGDYLRVMGSGVMDGNWLYLSNCNIGGGTNMFNPETNKWGIEGKDVRNVNRNSFIPPSFGIQNFNPNWSVQTIENLQSTAIAWDAMYMLGISENSVEKCKDKYAIFKVFKAWENARAAQVFSKELKEEMQSATNHYHIEQLDKKSWKLYQVSATGEQMNPRILKKK